MRNFLLLWLGQAVSFVGSGLTGFALGVWVFQQTGSATKFALISLAATLPGILASPFAGVLVDRWDRRWAMLLADLGAGLVTLAIALLVRAGLLEVWYLYPLLGVASVFGALQFPALGAAVTQLVPREHLGRAAGLTQLAEGIAAIVAPVLAGALLGLIGLAGIVLVDFATFLFAAATLLAVRVRLRGEPAAEGSRPTPLLADAAVGWRYVRQRPALLGLLSLFAAANLVLGMVYVLQTPLVLSFTTAAVLGRVLSVSGVGFLAGGLLMSAWGGPRRRVRGILLLQSLQGCILLLGGAKPSAALFAAAAFLFLAATPIVLGLAQAIWQSEVPLELQGRVFAVRRMVGWSALPFAYLLAGPLADRVFEPLLAPGGALAGSVGRLIGVGPGRGIGLLFIVLGLLLMATAAAAWQYRPLRQMEEEPPGGSAPRAARTSIG